jgi:hypothetical protein
MSLTLDAHDTAAHSASRDIERNSGLRVNLDGVFFTTASGISKLSKEQLERSPLLMHLSESYGCASLPCTQEEFKAWLGFDCCLDPLTAVGDDGLCQLLKVCQRAALIDSHRPLHRLAFHGITIPIRCCVVSCRGHHLLRHGRSMMFLAVDVACPGSRHTNGATRIQER